MTAISSGYHETVRESTELQVELRPRLSYSRIPDGVLELMDEDEKSDALELARRHGADNGRKISDDQSAKFQLFEDIQALQVDALRDS